MNLKSRIIVLLSIMFLLNTNTTKAQLVYIANIDPNSYYCEQTNETIYPKYKLKKSKNLELYVKDKLIYDRTLIPDGYVSLQYEIFNDSFLFITFIDTVSLKVSDPMYLSRKIINIMDFRNPELIYKLNLEGIKIINEEKRLGIFNKMKDFKIYAITKLTEEKIRLINNIGEEIEIPLEVFKNPLIESKGNR